MGSYFPSPKIPFFDNDSPSSKDSSRDNKTKWDNKITVKDAFVKNFAGIKMATNLLGLYEDVVFINQFSAFNLPLKNKNEIINYSLSLSEIAAIYSVFFNNGEACLFNFCLDSTSAKTNKQVIPTALNNQIDALLTYQIQEGPEKFNLISLGKEGIKVRGKSARVNNRLVTL